MMYFPHNDQDQDGTESLFEIKTWICEKTFWNYSDVTTLGTTLANLMDSSVMNSEWLINFLFRSYRK